MIDRAPDGAEIAATRAGSQRAAPFGRSCILLAAQKYAAGGNNEKGLYKLKFISKCKKQDARSCVLLILLV